MWKWFTLLGSGCLASRACCSECKVLHTEWLSHQERPRSSASSLAHAQPACRLLVKTLSCCSHISSEMETELVLLKLDACSRLLGNISSHCSFCESSISFFLVCKNLNQNLLNALDVLRFFFTKTKFFTIFYKVFFVLEWGSELASEPKKSVKCTALLVADCSL